MKRLLFAFAPWLALACSSSSSDAPAAGAPPAPITLESVSPQSVSARGGEMLVLKGAGFAADTVVKVGDVVATHVQVISPSELHVTTPALWAGAAGVETSGPGGDAKIDGALQVAPLDLRFVQAPTYSLSIAADVDGGVDAAAPPPVSPPVQAAATGDLDGDGDIDVVSCAANELCHLLANDGKGNFEDVGKTPFTAGTLNTHAVVVIDVDGDGDLDVVLAPVSGAPIVEVNDGHANFTEAKITLSEDADASAAAATTVSAIALSDLDGDGLPDLVLGNPLRVFRNETHADHVGFITWAEDALPAKLPNATVIAIADVDGDGKADVVLATPGATDGIELRLLLGSGDKLTEAHSALPNVAGADVSALVVADVTGDGHADILAAGKGQDRLLVNDGTGHFFDSTLTSMPLDGATASSIMLVDLDRDRDLDLVIGNHGAVTRLYLNDGHGVFRDYTPLLPLAATDAVWVAAADVDGDSDQDIFFVSAAPTTPRLYLSVVPQENQP